MSKTRRRSLLPALFAMGLGRNGRNNPRAAAAYVLSTVYYVCLPTAAIPYVLSSLDTPKKLSRCFMLFVRSDDTSTMTSSRRQGGQWPPCVSHPLLPGASKSLVGIASPQYDCSQRATSYVPQWQMPWPTCMDFSSFKPSCKAPN